MRLKSMLVSFHSVCAPVCVCVCVIMCVLFVNEMFFRPVDDTRPVWESSSPLFLSSPTSSLAYISSINPVLGGLLWSLCVLWAMVIICLLRSHCFMRLVCSLPPVPLPRSYSHFVSLALTASALRCVTLRPCPLSVSVAFPYYSTIPLSPRLSFCPMHLLSFAPRYLSFALKLSLLHRSKHNSLIHKAAKKPLLGKLLM